MKMANKRKRHMVNLSFKRPSPLTKWTKSNKTQAYKKERKKRGRQGSATYSSKSKLQ